jgi:ribosome-associated translation inhibitor RaiA
MQVLVRTNNNIDGSEGLDRHVTTTVEEALRRWADRITTVQVTINDVNGPKQGAGDKQCTMEARLGGLQPIVVHHDAATIDEVIDGAAEKLQRTIDRHLGRLSDQKGNIPIGGEPGV